MKLEQQLYDSSRLSVEEDKKYFVVGDLEYLSASPLYSCSIKVTVGGSGGSSFGKDSYSGSGSLKDKKGSGPLKLPKIEFPNPLPKISSGPIRFGGSKPIEFPKFPKKYELPEIPLTFPKPIGKVSDFQKGSYGNIFETANLGNFLSDDPDANKLNFQERYDFARRNGELPHLNLGLTKKKGYFPFGDVHKINLFDED